MTNRRILPVDSTHPDSPRWEPADSAEALSHPSQPPRRRSLFWPAFIVAFCLWLLASCGGVAALMGLDDLSLADLQSIGPVWTPPPASSVVTVSPGAAQSQTADQPPAGESTPPVEDARFQPGVHVQNITSSRVNIRREPGYLGASADDILAQMEPGETIEILGWPRNADSLIWWPIRYQSSTGTIEGWVAESTASGVQILAPLP